ncbi:hypothetical protein T484DRAFT_1761705, partial [Baffinella frigidus]
MDDAGPAKPFTVEYAKSGRAGCKSCKNKIDKDELRIGKMAQSPHFDGFVPLWHHAKCILSKPKIKIESTDDIAGFHELKFDDQQLIKNAISGKAVPAVPEKAKKAAAAYGDAGESAINCELAKSNRSSCRLCEECIEQGTLRV